MVEIRKVTPRHDLSWYVKWCASYLALLGMLFTSVEILPYNLYFHLLGVMGWGLVGMLWHDRALIFINSVATFIFATGILKYHFGG